MKFEEYFPVIRKLTKEQQKRIQEAVTEKSVENISSFCAKGRKMGIFPTLHRFNILLILHFTFLFYDE